MKTLAPIIVITTLSLSTMAMAKTDCHADLKDMLQGTLNMASEADNSQIGTPTDSTGGCTLAIRQDGSPAKVTI